MKHLELAPGIYWVGMYEHERGLHCNPYLIVDGNEAALIDPGSKLDFDVVFDNVTSLVPLENIKYVILNHQDPDLSSSVPLFEEKGLNAQVVTHWRSSVLTHFYGIKSQYYLVNENKYQLTFSSGRVLRFVQTPYLHFPGAIVTYDTVSRILFSSDLFGCYSYVWGLFADERYIESMKLFHENYMPSNDILRPVMELLLTMDISMIAPQHGSIIKAPVRKYVEVLRDLECGTMLHPIKKDLISRGQGYTGLCNRVIKRYCATFGLNDVLETFRDSSVILNSETGSIQDYNCTGDELWNNIFDIIFAHNGISWLSVSESLVNRLVAEYGVSYPNVFRSKLRSLEQHASALDDENRKLKEISDRLSANLKTAQNSMMRCPVTGLYNREFLINYLKQEFNSSRKQESGNKSLLFIEPDNVSEISLVHGHSAWLELLRTMTYVLNENRTSTEQIFRLEGAGFCCYLPECVPEQAQEKARAIRSEVEQSELFIVPVTVSIGVVGSQEFQDRFMRDEEIVDAVMLSGNMRLASARKTGGNTVCSSTVKDAHSVTLATVLIADSDVEHAQVLKRMFADQDIDTLCCADGQTALEMMEVNVPDVIISEIMLPKIDGFSLKEHADDSSRLKDIPFIIVSYQKDEDMVLRAMSLDVEHFFQKPYILQELVGIVCNKIKKNQRSMV